MCKKGLSVLVLLSLWMCLTGFASLGEEGKDTWNSMMEQLSAEEIDQLLAEENEWYGKVMANVEDSVTIRVEASTDSAAVGKMFKGDAGEILEQQEGWTRIQSGDVDGWVSDEYLAFGKDAEERAEEDVKKIATVTADGLKVRDEASTDSPVIDLIGHGEQIEVGEEEDGWLQIIYSDGEMDYVSADYVEVSYNYGEAKTMEQIEAEEAARRAEEEKAKRTKNLGAIAASTDEVTLLAALIQSESGNQPYEGQLGVGAVVMNRVRSGSYPNTIQGVISAPGQFGPAATGKVSAILASGPKASCMQAAQAAPTKEIKKNVPAMLSLVGLAEKYKSFPRQLSGGEQQRVALARALVNSPDILLADEPTGNLDPKTSREIMKLLEEINARGTTVLVVTHDQDIVNTLKKRVIRMQKGIITEDEKESGYIG